MRELKRREEQVVTIFGGSGFIGRYVVAVLARDGWRIRVAVRDPQKAAFLKACGDVGQVVPLAVDVSDPASVARIIQGSSVVINLIGILLEQGKQRFDLLQSKVPGIIAVAAREAGAKALIQMSAIGADLNSTSRYGQSKAEGEAAARMAFPSAVIVRPSIVFGPEDDFFNRFAKMAQVSPFLPLVGGGHNRFQPVYVGDVAKAVRQIVLQPEKYSGEICELGGPRVMTFRECLELLLRVTGLNRLLVNLPFWLARVMSIFMTVLPNPPLTLDQLRMLEKDNITSDHVKNFGDLGIRPVDPILIVPGYLSQYRRGGR
ncbi:complex I NDUFA9 subunit family protein [Kiloniella laminariae]|uniref:complex I NDUFA9 subunit family protein n=1 Tax=Kiloniella laminariae TaxID=454162 RepID=UPI000382B5F5|nr:complex I NDUFA9 subunit family protein [Kiloniella laminariae]